VPHTPQGRCVALLGESFCHGVYHDTKRAVLAALLALLEFYFFTNIFIILGPFSLCETLPEECTDRAQGIWGHTQPLNTPMVNYPQHMTNQTQCHTPTLAGVWQY
jgi:hypothetical protein